MIDLSSLQSVGSKMHSCFAESNSFTAVTAVAIDAAAVAAVEHDSRRWRGLASWALLSSCCS